MKKKFVLVNYLKKDEKNNKVVLCTQTEDGAKEAILDYQVLDTKDDMSLVKVLLQTGRSHQIRVQMKSIKCPVYGDQKYGGEGMDKVMLNLFAVELAFNHPTTKQKMKFRVYPPEEAAAWNEFKLEKYLSLKSNNDD